MDIAFASTATFYPHPLILRSSSYSLLVYIYFYVWVRYWRTHRKRHLLEVPLTSPWSGVTVFPFPRGIRLISHWTTSSKKIHFPVSNFNHLIPCSWVLDQELQNYFHLEPLKGQLIPLKCQRFEHLTLLLAYWVSDETKTRSIPFYHSLCT